MLVLTRRGGEAIVMSGGIRITFLGYKGGQARIGIDAPREITIDRAEVAERKEAERAKGAPPGEGPTSE